MPPKAVKKSAFCVTIDIYDPHTKRALQTTKKGRLFEVAGRPVLVFPVRVFALAMDRTWQTLVRWEKAKKLPRPTWTVDGKKERLYSRAQVLLANELWKKYRHQGKSQHFDMDKFLKELSARFYLVDLEEAKAREIEEDNR